MAEGEGRSSRFPGNAVNDEDSQTFLRAAHAGNVTQMRELLNEQKVDVNVICSNETALHIACRCQNIETVQFLVDCGADVNKTDIRGKHSLHVAVSSGNAEITRYLIEKGSNTALMDKYGRSPLHWAALNRHYDVVNVLLEHGAKVWYNESGNWQPIHESVKVGDCRITQILIDKGSPVNNPEISQSKVRPFSPLHIAAREGHIDCVLLLLKNGAVVDYLNAGRQSPLHEAAHSGAEDVVRALLLHGSNPNIENNLCRTALHEACSGGHMNCAILLLDAGCRVNHRDHLSETALLLLLRHAIKNIDLAPDPLVIFCDLLLQYGANPCLPGMKLQTAVTLANAMINKSFENTLCHSLENPRPLRHQCKINIRLQFGCNYEKINLLKIPLDLRYYLLQNSTFYSDTSYFKAIL